MVPRYDDTTGNPVQRNPRIAGTAAGLETAVWVDFRASQLNIYSSQLTTAGGSTWGANERVTDNTSSSVSKDFPDVAVGTDGTAYAVWQDSRNGNPDIYFSKLPRGASAWTANVKVSDDPGAAAQHHARVGVDALGNVTVVWLDDRTSPSKIRMSRLASGSATWTTSVTVTDAAARPLSTALSVRADGKAFLLFHDNLGSSTDVYGMEYDPWLNTWTASSLVSDDPGSAAQQSPTVAYGTGDIAAAWRDDRAGNADVRARRAALTGTDHASYVYDGVERLTATTGTNPESFVLDAASNISSRTGPGATNTYDTANRLTSDGTQTYVWSQTDRLNSRGTDVFSYDALDRLTGSTIAGTARSYTYNGDGLLQSRTTGASTAALLWDSASTPARTLLSDADRIIYGLGPIYGVNGATTTTYARDGLGSIRAMLSGTGAVTASWRYRVYGDIAQFSGSSAPALLGYAGQLRDPSGLYFLRARWYDPATARFLSRDPAAGDAARPVSLNAFAYADGRPTVLRDPSGRCPICLAVVAIVEAGEIAGLAARVLISTQGTMWRAGDTTVIENVQGPARGVLDFFGAEAMTLGSDFVYSKSKLTNSQGQLNETGRHEFAHVAQARELGALYTPEYLLDWAAAWLVQDFLRERGYEVELHDAHPMEVDANYRAGLPLMRSLRKIE